MWWNIYDQLNLISLALLSYFMLSFIYIYVICVKKASKKEGMKKRKILCNADFGGFLPSVATFKKVTSL